MTHTEIEITAELVRDLLLDQHPDLADRPVRLGARGWDNQLWRLGDDLAVRLPWATESADALVRKEHAWLPALAPRLPLPVPVPQRLGEPSERFPRPWIVTTWVPGEPADRFHRAYRPTADAATLRRARGWAVWRALGGILIGEAGVRGRPGGKPTWGPPAHTALRRLVAAARS
ncbi:phosphotransferase [Streptomyces diastatochromogenes]|uniref:phosphotransferase n=1 Tax=Streptomyces diastatochromogenes TaxID=42236 RepID=UPI003646C6BE